MYRKLKSAKEKFAWHLNGKYKNKIFCIGRNKTGTTSMLHVFKEFGFKLGHQPTAELLLKDYIARNWKPILDYCQTAQAFQDAPFSWPETWKQLVKRYPDARYILTYRDQEAWYNSITKFHSKKFSDGLRTPSKEDLKMAKYRSRGLCGMRTEQSIIRLKRIHIIKKC